MTETTNKGELFYDATCRFCTNGVNRLRPWLAMRNIAPVPFANGAEESEMLLNWHDGRTFGGADAAIFMARQFWFSWPLAILAMLPGFHQIAHAGYRAIASRRQCINGVCEIDLTAPKNPARPALGWFVLILFIGTAMTVGFVFTIPAWLEMWILAGALWSGFKIMAIRTAGGFSKIGLLFFSWIGTDTKAFRKNQKPIQTDLEWRTPIAFIIAGLILLTLVLPKITDPIAIGWIGVITMLSLFHFGSFAVLATLFRSFEFAVEPIMQAPWAAKTLAEFWGPRWNRAFSDWARIHVFRPLVRKFGTARGTFAGFLASGIAHELVISLPARAGYGLPTLFFVIQAAVLLAQRKYAPLRNRVVTLAAVLIPAPILFHPTFIERVFTPMMRLVISH